MPIINEEIVERLLNDVKTFINMTWTDYNRESLLKQYIRSSASYLEHTYGHALTFDTDNGLADGLAHDLLLNRVFYMNEKALDDFEPNYTSELLKLSWLGKILNYTESTEGSADGDSDA